MYEVINKYGVIVAFIEANNFVAAEAAAIDQLGISPAEFDADYCVDKITN